MPAQIFNAMRPVFCRTHQITVSTDMPMPSTWAVIQYGQNACIMLYCRYMNQAAQPVTAPHTNSMAL